MIEKRIELPDDYEGKVIATLIESKAEASNSPAILYLHGYIDYFFQYHMAEIFNRAGYHFYALDLRKYGRSYLPHQHPCYCRDMNEYYPEMDHALEEIRRGGHDSVTLLGHSTGGLLATLYCAEDGEGGKERDLVDRIILNSPFLEFNTSWLKRKLAIPLVSQLGRLFRYGHMKNELSPLYGMSVHKSGKGEWDFDLKLKPKEGIPLYFAWLRAIRKGQKRIKQGLEIKVPVLVMHSDCSSWEKEWSEILKRTDAVLDVDDIRHYAPRLGKQIELAEIRGGMHDLVLSTPPVRKEVFRKMLNWLAGQQ